MKVDDYQFSVSVTYAKKLPVLISPSDLISILDQPEHEGWYYFDILYHTKEVMRGIRMASGKIDLYWTISNRRDFYMHGVIAEDSIFTDLLKNETAIILSAITESQNHIMWLNNLIRAINKCN